MSDQSQRLKDVTIVAQEAARIAYEHPVDIWEYRRLSDEEKALLYATIRGHVVHMATERYPGHLYAFTDPQVEKPGGEFSIGADKAMSRAVIIRCQALVFAPQMIPAGDPLELASRYKAAFEALDQNHECSCSECEAARSLINPP